MLAAIIVPFAVYWCFEASRTLTLEHDRLVAWHWFREQEAALSAITRLRLGVIACDWQGRTNMFVLEAWGGEDNVERLLQATVTMFKFRDLRRLVHHLKQMIPTLKVDDDLLEFLELERV